MAFLILLLIALAPASNLAQAKDPQVAVQVHEARLDRIEARLSTIEGQLRDIRSDMITGNTMMLIAVLFGLALPFGGWAFKKWMDAIKESLFVRMDAFAEDQSEFKGLMRTFERDQIELKGVVRMLERDQGELKDLVRGFDSTQEETIRRAVRETLDENPVLRAHKDEIYEDLRRQQIPPKSP